MMGRERMDVCEKTKDKIREDKTKKDKLPGMRNSS